MALKLELATLDGLDDATKALYAEKDGKFRLDVDGVEDVSGLKAKIAELMGETKAAKDARKALEDAAEAADAERAKQAGEFKTLYEKTASDLEKERTEKREFIAKVQRKDLETEAAKFAGTLTRDTSRAEDLAELFIKHAKNTDDGVRLELGGIEITRDKFAEHIKTVRPYLVDGNQAGGGGAPGGGGGAAKKTISELTEAERRELQASDPKAFKSLVDEAKRK